MKAVLFDLDDTLIVEVAHARACLAEALGLVLGEVSDAAVDTIIECARVHWRGSPLHPVTKRLGVASWEGLWANFEGCHMSLGGLAAWAASYPELAWRDALSALGADPAGWHDVAQRYVECQRRGHPGLVPALDAVAVARSAGLRTGILTNGLPDIQRLKLTQAGLDVAVDVVVISGDVGVGKPSPEVYRLILDALVVDAADAVMIGDSWDNDVLGALETGVRSVWVSHGRPLPETREDVVVVDELTPAVLELL